MRNIIHNKQISRIERLWRIALLLLLPAVVPLTSAAQSSVRDIVGRVVDESNEPLPGATIRGNDNKQMTVTDLDGKFSIKVAAGTRLNVTYVGFERKEVVATKEPMTIVLTSSVSKMNELVVVGYGTARRSDVATAVSPVNMEELAKSGSTQTLEALQGKVAGLQITSSDGSLAGGMTFTMRGVNSITGGTQPLFVIDGVPQPVSEPNSADIANNPLMGLNPSDIESIEVLKDAAAASIYGTKGSNGVVIITTKKGQLSSKPKFTISLAGGLEFKPETALKVLTPERYAHKMLERGTYDNEQYIAFWNGVINSRGWEHPSVHNWMDDILQTGTKYDLNASMSGGTQGTSYMLSAGYSNTRGLIRRSSFDRFTSRLNLQQTVSKTVSVGLNSSFSTSLDKNPTSDWSQSGVVLNALQRSPFLFYPGFADLMNYSNVSIMSPLVAVEQVDISNRYTELNANLWLSWEIVPSLTFSTSGSYRRAGVKSTRLWGRDTWFGQSENGRMETGDLDENSWVYEGRLSWAKDFGAHSVTAMGAFEASKWWMNNNYN
ncbi:MAG: SusC/RagA family TonB-linked outer membrane protein, partial [Muribaculaceae bacterium]|nr:SusC/RagA family TonB-linked outer membrane protein [Muribaculaceae bacterium]